MVDVGDLPGHTFSLDKHTHEDGVPSNILRSAAGLPRLPIEFGRTYTVPSDMNREVFMAQYEIPEGSTMTLIDEDKIRFDPPGVYVASPKETKDKSFDAVARPAHYTRGKIEVRNFIRDQQLNFNLGSVIKYVCRAGFKSKDTHLQDLRKARQFLDFEIEAVEGELDASAE